MQNVVKNEWKQYSNAKCSPRLIQNVVEIRYKMSKNNTTCSQEWMETENQCKMYSKNNVKYSPKIMQNAVQIEWKVYSYAKSCPKIMQNVVQIWCKM